MRHVESVRLPAAHGGARRKRCWLAGCRVAQPARMARRWRRGHAASGAFRRRRAAFRLRAPEARQRAETPPPPSAFSRAAAVCCRAQPSTPGPPARACAPNQGSAQSRAKQRPRPKTSFRPIGPLPGMISCRANSSVMPDHLLRPGRGRHARPRPGAGVSALRLRRCQFEPGSRSSTCVLAAGNRQGRGRQTGPRKGPVDHHMAAAAPVIRPSTAAAPATRPPRSHRLEPVVAGQAWSPARRSATADVAAGRGDRGFGARNRRHGLSPR